MTFRGAKPRTLHHHVQAWPVKLAGRVIAIKAIRLYLLPLLLLINATYCHFETQPEHCQVYRVIWMRPMSHLDAIAALLMSPLVDVNVNASCIWNESILK